MLACAMLLAYEYERYHSFSKYTYYDNNNAHIIDVEPLPFETHSSVRNWIIGIACAGDANIQIELCRNAETQFE